MDESTASASQINSPAPKTPDALPPEPCQVASAKGDTPQTASGAPDAGTGRKRRERSRNRGRWHDERKFVLSGMGLLTAALTCLAAGLAIVKVFLEYLMKIAATGRGL